jgi:hypothetical protein
MLVKPSLRHPEVLGADAPSREGRWPVPVHPSRLASLAPQDDGERLQRIKSGA